MSGGPNLAIKIARDREQEALWSMLRGLVVFEAEARSDFRRGHRLGPLVRDETRDGLRSTPLRRHCHDGLAPSSTAGGTDELRVSERLPAIFGRQLRHAQHWKAIDRSQMSPR